MDYRTAMACTPGECVRTTRTFQANPDMDPVKAHLLDRYVKTWRTMPAETLNSVLAVVGWGAIRFDTGGGD